MKSRSKIILEIKYPGLDIFNKLLSTIMNSDDTLTDKEYNSIKEARDSISNARDTWHINFYNSDGIIGGGFPVEGYENAVEAALKYSLENLI